MKSEQFLKIFHDQSPGETPQFMALGRSQAGKSSYEIVIDALPKPFNGEVLDIACGDGFLLSQMTEHGIRAERLVGIDISTGELESARKRPELKGARLEIANARSLPLNPNSVSAVTCHMALMLMNEVDGVISEVARVLAPGGSFLSFINRRGATRSATAEIYFELLPEYMSQADINFCQSIGDARLSDSETAKRLFLENGFSEVELVDDSLDFTGSPRELVDYFDKLYYRHYLSREQAAAFSEKLFQRFKTIADKNGNVSHEMFYRLIKAKKQS